MSNFAAERAVREERQNAFEGTKVHLEKLNRGERLSVEERADLAQRQMTVARLTEELRSYEEARELSRVAGAEVGSTPETAAPVDPAEARERAFSHYVRTGELSAEMRSNPQGVGTGAAGGFTVPPGWWQRLQIAMKVYGGTANDFFSLETESGQPMQWATNDPTSTVGTLVGTPGNNENVQITEVDYTFGQGTLGAYMFTSGVQLVSLQLANDSAFNMDSFVQDRIAESLGRARAQYAISGSGTNQPLGVITALGAATGLTSGGVFSLTAATKVGHFGDPTGAAGGSTELLLNSLSFQSILGMIHGVDPAYRALGAKWYLNDTQCINLMSVTDLYGRPLWEPSVQQGAPDRLYKYDVVIDNNIPNLSASTAGGPIFGHLPSAMVLRTVTQAGVLRLTERYADFLQVGFIGFNRWDIRSNDLRAAIVAKPAAT